MKTALPDLTVETKKYKKKKENGEPGWMHMPIAGLKPELEPKPIECEMERKKETCAHYEPRNDCVAQHYCDVHTWR